MSLDYKEETRVAGGNLQTTGRTCNLQAFRAEEVIKGPIPEMWGKYNIIIVHWNQVLVLKVEIDALQVNAHNFLNVIHQNAS